MDEDGLPSLSPVTSPSNGLAPFGYTFTQQGHLLVSEAGIGAVSSYDILSDGTIGVFRITSKGTLIELETIDAGLSIFAQGIAER